MNDDEAENIHLNEIVASIENYSQDVLNEFTLNNLHIVNSKYFRHLVENIVTHNQNFCDCILNINHAYNDRGFSSSLHNISKVRSTLKQVVREWSIFSQLERSQIFDFFINTAEAYLPKGSKIVCPGIGLGRLLHDLANVGYVVEGNEFSYHMLLTSSLLLNCPEIHNKLVLFPYVSNLQRLHFNTNCQPIKCPDIRACLPKEPGSMCMCAGEFVAVYNEQDRVSSIDCFMSCFFLDTAKNVMQYIRTIASLLPVNALWVNMGPLLYHFADIENELSIDLPLDIVIKLIKGYFTIINMSTKADVAYSEFFDSLKSNKYTCYTWVAKRNNTPVTGISKPVYG